MKELHVSGFLLIAFGLSGAALTGCGDNGTAGPAASDPPPPPPPAQAQPEQPDPYDPFGDQP